MNTQAYIVAAMLGRYILIAICFLVLIQVLLEIRKASLANQYNISDSLASVKWLRKRAIFELDQDNIIGRSNACDVVIKSATVKRKHFKLYLDCGEWILEPYKNCEVFLNKSLLSNSALISDGDKISIGRENLIFNITHYANDELEEDNV